MTIEVSLARTADHVDQSLQRTGAGPNGPRSCAMYVERIGFADQPEGGEPDGCISVSLHAVTRTGRRGCEIRARLAEDTQQPNRLPAGFLRAGRGRLKGWTVQRLSGLPGILRGWCGIGARAAGPGGTER